MKTKNKIHFFGGLLLAVSFLVVGLIFYTGKMINRTESVGVGSSQDVKVLGESDEWKEIFVYKNNSYETGGIVMFASSEEPAVMVSGYEISGPANVDVYKADYNRVLDYLIYNEEHNQLKGEVDIAGLNKVASFSQNVTKEDSRMLLPLDKAGVWFVRVSLGETREDFFAVRSDFGALVKEGDDELIFWAQDFETRRAVGGISLNVYSLKNKSEKIYSASFDEQGIAKTPISAEADVAVLERGGSAAIVPLNLRRLNGYGWGNEVFNPKVISTRFFTFTDRPLYLPGDTVYFKSIIRSDDDARYSIPSGQIEVTARFGWGDDAYVVFAKKLDISPLGTVSGDFKLPEDADTGWYNLEIKIPDAGIPDSWDYTNKDIASFNVEYYRKPEYTVDIEVPGDEFIMGDRSAFLIKGFYFSGQPLSGKKVNYKIYSSDYYLSDYYYDNNKDDINSDSYYGYYSGKVIKEGEGIFNGRGEAKIGLEISSPSEKSGSQIYSIEAEYKDESGNPVLARKNVLVYAGEFEIFRKAGDFSSKAGKKISFPLILISNYSNPGNFTVNKALTAKISRNYWEKKKVEGQKYSEYEQKQDEFSEASLVTDNKGEAVFSFVPKKEGSYEVLIEGSDSRNNKIQKSFYFWISDESGYYYSGESDSKLTVSLDKEEYDPGGKAQLNISSDIPDRDLFLSLSRARVNTFQIVKLKGKNTTVEIPLIETDIPNIFVSVSSFSKDNLDVASENLVVSGRSKQLDIKIMPDKKDYAPGDTATVNIQAADALGNPVVSDIALWSVDKALYELADDNTGKIFDTFWYQRDDDTSASHSLVGISADMAEKGGGGGDQRTVFEDLAYWNPAVRTNEAGNAQVTFKLPDNLTTWVLAAVGATNKTQVGQSTREIQVSKDIVVRPVLPNILRKGDKITLSAYVHNFSEQDQQFNVELKFDSGKVESPAQEKAIKAKSMGQFIWAVYPEKENPAAKLIFSAISENNSKLADIVVKEVPLENFGFWETTTEAGNGDRSFGVKLHPDSDRNKTEIELSIASSLMGTLPDAMEYLIQYPYGCVEQTTSRLVPALIAKKNPELFKEALEGKKIDDIINEGLKKLKTLQGSDGGWGWWGESVSDPFVTAYVAGYLREAGQLGYKVNEQMLVRAKNFFERGYYYSADGDKEIPYNKREDAVAMTYALAMLDSEKGKQKLDNLDGLSADVLAFAVLANLKNGYTESKTNGLDRLMFIAEKQGDGAFWQGGSKTRFGSTDASTALAVRAMVLGGGDQNLMIESVRYLAGNRKKNYWSNTFATAQVIEALVAFSNAQQESDANYEYTVLVDGKEARKGKMLKFNQTDVIKIPAISIKENGSNVAIKKIGEGKLYATLATNDFRTDRNAGKKDNGIKVAREYIDSRGAGYPIGVGDMIEVKISVNGLKANENYAVIKDELPSGMIPINTQLNNEQEEGDRFSDQFNLFGKEFTPNGIIIYLDGVGEGNHAYSYRARVISAGEFTAPPATASLMYSPEIYGRSDAPTVKIERETAVAIESGTKTKSGNNNAKIIAALVIILGTIISTVIIAVIVIKKRQAKQARKDVEQ